MSTRRPIGHHRSRPPPDPSLIWPSNGHYDNVLNGDEHLYYTPPDATSSSLHSHSIVPTFASIYPRNTNSGHSSTALYVDKAESDSLHYYENNLERHKGMFCLFYCVFKYNYWNILSKVGSFYYNSLEKHNDIKICD
jgi:hypothetical protein